MSQFAVLVGAADQSFGEQLCAQIHQGAPERCVALVPLAQLERTRLGSQLCLVPVWSNELTGQEREALNWALGRKRASQPCVAVCRGWSQPFGEFETLAPLRLFEAELATLEEVLIALAAEQRRASAPPPRRDAGLGALSLATGAVGAMAAGVFGWVKPEAIVPPAQASTEAFAVAAAPGGGPSSALHEVAVAAVEQVSVAPPLAPAVLAGEPVASKRPRVRQVDFATLEPLAPIPDSSFWSVELAPLQRFVDRSELGVRMGSLAPQPLYVHTLADLSEQVLGRLALSRGGDSHRSDS